MSPCVLHVEVRHSDGYVEHHDHEWSMSARDAFRHRLEGLREGRTPVEADWANLTIVRGNETLRFEDVSESDAEATLFEMEATA